MSKQRQYFITTLMSIIMIGMSLTVLFGMAVHLPPSMNYFIFPSVVLLSFTALFIYAMKKYEGLRDTKKDSEELRSKPSSRINNGQTAHQRQKGSQND